MNKPTIKKELLNLCFQIQKNRVDNARKAMEDAQNAANQEEKSTAGDKYDTSRAMSQNLRDMNAKQLQEALKDLSVLEQINPENNFHEVKPGSVVKTEEGNYFIATSIGQLKYQNESYFVISSLSPIGMVLANKKPGEAIEFRGKSIKLIEVF